MVEAAGRVSAAPEHTAAIGLKVGAMGLVTLMVAVVVHPLLFVNVIVLVPKPTAVTSPEFEMVATATLLETQGELAFGLAFAVSCEVVFGQITVFPDNTGLGETVTVT